MKKIKKSIHSLPVILAFVLAVIGFILLVYFSLHPVFNDKSFDLNPDLAAKFGTFISGVLGPLFSFASFLLIYKTISLQLNTSRKDQFESRFFKLLEIHRDNVKNMEHFTSNGNSRQGVQLFTYFKDIFFKLLGIIKNFDSNILNNEEVAELSFLIFFFGLFKDKQNNVVIHTFKFGKKEQTTEYNNEISSILEKLSKSKVYDSNLYGHESKLGHYFRHLYQTVDYVDKQTFLSDEEKYEFVKMIRAQLSQYELIIFFFNTFTTFANPWKEKKLIVKYRFLKNIPYDTCMGYDPKKYFDFEYEWEKAFQLKNEHEENQI